MKHSSTLLLVSLCAAVPALAQNYPGWPRTITKAGAQLVCYQPQIDDWKNFKQLDGRMAVSLKPAGGTPAPGVVVFQARTDVNVETHTVVLSDLRITRTDFPSQNPGTEASLDRLVRGFLPPGKTMTTSLDRLVAAATKSKSALREVAVDNAPPRILVSYGPAILLQVNGAPVRAAVKKTDLEAVVNSNFPLFIDKPTSRWYLFSGKGWLAASAVQGPWAGTPVLPKGMDKVAADPNWVNLKTFVPPPPGSASHVPEVVYSASPAELVVFNGQPVYAAIPGVNLVYATNTGSMVFVYSPTGAYYYLTAGRWFSAPSLNGPWTYATPRLPADFARIPQSSPVAGVLASVPGTPEAADAVLLAQVPITAEVNPAEAAAKVKVNYAGPPQFRAIEGTSMSYAVNTPERVIQVGNLYYLCFQGVWFVSTTPQGPWETAQSVPSVIYTIPPSSPVYNVTYVTQTPLPNGNVQSSYTAGYLGTFVTGVALGAVIAGGTGYYYPPYIAYGVGVYPVYYPYAATYGAFAWESPYTGVYHAGGAVYGPYGGAGYRAAYNPYTGTYARGATAYGPYGSRSAGEAYNPYTGAYAATRQGSNAYSQWGSSVVGRGDQSASMQHYTGSRGTVASAQTSAGGKAVGASTAGGSAFGAKSSGGDMYAGHDGNVYRNTGNGWQTYSNGSWNNVEKPSGSTPRSAAGGGPGQGQGLQQDFADRQRGAAASERFGAMQQGRFGRGGGGFRGRR